MSRAGYVDDLEQKEMAMWRGQVASSIRGKRGQKLLTDLRNALDAMSEKKLIAGALVDEEGACCALGCVGLARNIKPLMDETDPEEYADVAAIFDISEPLAREIAYENDERAPSDPEERWAWMRRWCEKHIAARKGQQ